MSLHRSESHDPLKPALVAALALALFYAAGGRLRLRSQWPGLARHVDDRVVAGALAAAVCVAGIVFATTVAGGARLLRLPVTS